MDKTPFFAGVQQELFFLPVAARALADGGPTGGFALLELEIAIAKRGLSDEHLDGLGLFRSPEVIAAGLPVSPDEAPERAKTVSEMAMDCLDQLQRLEVADEEGRVTPDSLRNVENREWLRRALRVNYGVAGRDDQQRSVVSHMRRAAEALTGPENGSEHEEDPRSVIYRQAFCLPEFMWLHFWLQELSAPPRWADFGSMLLLNRWTALSRLDRDEDDIEYAGLVMADFMADQLLDQYPQAADKIAAARSSVLMLCDAGAIAPVGYPGELQWLHPVMKEPEEDTP